MKKLDGEEKKIWNWIIALFFTVVANDMNDKFIIINNKYLPYIKRFEPYSDRLYYNKHKCKHMSIIIINDYANMEDKKQDKKELSMKIWKDYMSQSPWAT